ncbi:MAG: class I SAM-dependent methyltransferase [Gemmatimonadaceae bacterium]|nr:class I SAM-dependent methyltransferase [Gemmatimonadaceae bacterium]
MTLRSGSDGQKTTFIGAWFRATVGAAYSLAMALPSRAMRPRVVRLAREFGYDHRVGPRPTLPTMEIHEAAPDVAIRVREPLSADGNVTLLELTVLNALVAARRPERIFEIGTFDGRTTLNFAANAPDAAVYTLDLPTASIPALAVHSDDRQFIGRSQGGARGARFRAAVERERITQLEGDSATFDYSPFAKTVDFVFVDGAHSYDYVMSDSRKALELAAPGALIAWHDYGEWEGVTRALNELHASDTRFGAMRHVRGTTLALLEV